MTGQEKQTETNETSHSSKTSNHSLEVSLALYEDSKQNNPSLLGSALSLKADNPATFQTMQMSRELIGQKPYPDLALLNKPINLDDQTVREVLENPLTKQALPYATIGFLYDNYESIRDPKQQSIGFRFLT